MCEHHKQSRSIHEGNSNKLNFSKACYSSVWIRLSLRVLSERLKVQCI